MNTNRLLRMRLIDIEAVLNIPEFGSFNKTAEEYCISPSGLSRAVSKFEDAAGFKIIDRKPGLYSNPMLTNEAMELKNRIQSAIDVVNGEHDDIVVLKAKLQAAEDKLRRISQLAQQDQ